MSQWDPDHEGHAGYLAIDIANQYLEGWLGPTAPDIVLFHLGTNDISGGHSTDEIIAAYEQMVDLMPASNPAVNILVRLHLRLVGKDTKTSRSRKSFPCRWLPLR